MGDRTGGPNHERFDRARRIYEEHRERVGSGDAESFDDLLEDHPEGRYHLESFRGFDESMTATVGDHVVALSAEPRWSTGIGSVRIAGVNAR